MKLIDTNIVVYSLGQEHPYKKPCEQIIRQIGEGNQDFTIDAETMQEVLHIFAYRGERSLGIEAVRRLLNLFPNVIPITSREIEVALTIFFQHRNFASRDAIHAAVVQTHALDGIVSADRAFDGITGLVRYDPVAMVGGQGR